MEFWKEAGRAIWKVLTSWTIWWTVIAAAICATNDLSGFEADGVVGKTLTYAPMLFFFGAMFMVAIKHDQDKK